MVVVDNGSTDATGFELRNYSWVDVVSNEANCGFGAGCNQGAAAARGQALVFLNNDTLVFDGWLEELLLPFADPTVGAVGPRSNSVSGHQIIQDIPYQGEGAAAIGEFAQAWKRAHAGQTSDCARLVGFCLAIRSEVFTRIGGFDEAYGIGGFEDDDLCMKLRGAGLRLVVAHGSFVHHAGHATFDFNGIKWQHQVCNQELFVTKWGIDSVPPLCLLSVCLIVKDEEQMLQSCLDSIADIADEIVVYDTGSSDNTVEIAKAAGARVIEGYWDDSFARARNAALEQASGEWILSLDADEHLLADPEMLRATLSDRRSNLEAYLVAIENLHGLGNARSVHTAIRLFRRTSCTWLYRLHEQVVAADDPSRPLRLGYLSGSRIIHYGYVAEVLQSKNKAERNLALARQAVEDEVLNKPYALMNYGRALDVAGQSTEAVEVLKEAASIAEEPITRRMAINNLVYILGRLSRFDEALDQVEELRRTSVSQIAADIAEGSIRISMGDVAAGLSMLARVPSRGRDDDGMEYTAHTLASIRGEALASLGRFAEAADVVLDAVRAQGLLEADLGELVFWLIKAHRSPSEIADALEVDDLMGVLGRLLRQPAAVADSVLEAIWQKFPDRLEPLAAAGRLGPRLPVARALVWSSRLRNRGLPAACPLVAMANNEQLDPRVRILAAAAAFGSFADHSVINALHQARSLLDPEALAQSTEEVSRIAPGLLEASHADPVVANVEIAPVGSVPIERGRRGSTSLPPQRVAAVTRRGGINIVGAFESTSVEGDIARALANTLGSHGMSVSTTSYHSDGQPGLLEWTHHDEGDHPFDTTLLVLSPQDLTNFVFDHGAACFEARYMIGVWRCDFERPPQTMSTASSIVHEIWVPSAFSAASVTRATSRPVLRMLLPITTEWRQEGDDASETGFTFVASVDYAEGFERQNPLGAVEAFSGAFQPGEGPKLLIETTHAERFPAEHARLVAAASKRSDIELVNDYHKGLGHILNDRAAARSCFVSLHRSEGTGLAIGRAMTAGVPTIVTGHSFSAELQSERDSFQVPFVLKAIPDLLYRSSSQGRWAEPSLTEAAKAMRLVAGQPKLALMKAQRARERYLRQFSPARSARAMKERLAAIERRRYGNVHEPQRTDSHKAAKN
ncbi:glycosyltransferase [bacterium]|nr:MAG: glycosyltransferase [bacterium]